MTQCTCFHPIVSRIALWPCLASLCSSSRRGRDLCAVLAVSTQLRYVCSLPLTSSPANSLRPLLPLAPEPRTRRGMHQPRSHLRQLPRHASLQNAQRRPTPPSSQSLTSALLPTLSPVTASLVSVSDSAAHKHDNGLTTHHPTLEKTTLQLEGQRARAASPRRPSAHYIHIPAPSPFASRSLAARPEEHPARHVNGNASTLR